MIRQFKNSLVAAIAAATLATPALAQQKSSEQRPAADPNSRVCEDVVQLGSRLAKKRVCGTKAEWDEKKRQDREATEKAQTQLCVNNPATDKC